MLTCRGQEVVNQASFLYWMSFRWAAVRMEFLGVLMMAAASYSVILFSRDDAGLFVFCRVSKASRI